MAASCARRGGSRYEILRFPPFLSASESFQLWKLYVGAYLTRALQCDEARPTCGNCAKSGRDCPGYPDEFDLIFRNETKAVKRRADKASSKKSKAPEGAPR